MLIKALRIGLGQLIIFIDFITRPRKMQRSPEAQAEVNQSASNLALYQFRACSAGRKSACWLLPASSGLAEKLEACTGCSSQAHIRENSKNVRMHNHVCECRGAQDRSWRLSQD